MLINARVGWGAGATGSRPRLEGRGGSVKVVGVVRAPGLIRGFDRQDAALTVPIQTFPRRSSQTTIGATPSAIRSQTSRAGGPTPLRA